MLTVSSSPSRHEWDSFVLSSPQCSPFVLSTFLDSTDLNYARLAFYDQSSIVALVVFPVDTTHGRIVASTRYQGLLLPPRDYRVYNSYNLDLAIVSEVLEYLAVHYPSHTLSLSPGFLDIRPFQWHKYHGISSDRYSITQGYTGIIDFSGYSSFTEYFSSIRTNRKRDFNKALKHNLTFSVSDNLDQFFRLFSLTYARQSIELSTSRLGFLRNLLSSLLSNHFSIDLHFAFHQDQPISAIVTLSDSTTTYYWFGASDPAFRHTGCGTFTLINSIHSSFNSPLLYYDFLGMNSPSRGDFKSSLGAIPTLYFTASLN
jgi:hypothetical protein